MSIGKNSILRVKNAEKNGAMTIVSEAPDMENSTPVVTQKATTKKKSATSKKTAIKKEATEIVSAQSKPKNETLGYCPIGAEMPVHLL